MPNEAHIQSERRASEAEALLRAGTTDAARDLYLQAARHELDALQTIPPGQPRTQGILSVSAVSLFFKASALEEAEAHAYSFLNQQLPEFARDQLRELLQVVWEEKALKGAGLRYTGETISVSMRGAEIGAGRAPMALVVDRIGGIHTLLYRITEWLGGFPFRTRGAPPDVVRELCQPWVGEPQAGSYRFAVRFVQPIQLELIPALTINPSDLNRWFFRFVRAVSPTTLTPSESVQDLIPDTRYRHAILKLTRNIAPDGQRVKEIEFVSDTEQVRERALFHSGARIRIEDSLTADEPAGTSDHIAGVLRAVHLDRRWLEVLQESGNPQRCRIAGEVLDDVVGPMLNHRVIVRGKWKRHGAQFDLMDIELDSSPEKKPG